MSACHYEPISPYTVDSPADYTLDSPGSSFEHYNAPSTPDSRARCLQDARHLGPCWTARHRLLMEDSTLDERPVGRGRPSICLLKFLRRLENRSGGSLIREPPKRGRPSIPLEPLLGRPIPHPEPPKLGRPRKEIRYPPHRPQQPQQSEFSTREPLFSYRQHTVLSPTSPSRQSPMPNCQQPSPRSTQGFTHYQNPNGTAAPFPEGLTVTRVVDSPVESVEDDRSNSPPLPLLFPIPPPPPAAIVLSPRTPQQPLYEVFYADERSPVMMRLSEKQPFGLAGALSIGLSPQASSLFSPMGAEGTPERQHLQNQIQRAIDTLGIEEDSEGIDDEEWRPSPVEAGGETVSLPTPTFENLFSDSENETMEYV